MLFQNNEQLDEYLVKCLAHRHSMTAAELKKGAAERSGRKFTAQAVFKELSKLQRGGVVVRCKRHYSLSLSWALRFVTMGDVIYDAYLLNSPLELIMAEKTAKKTWRCSDFDKVSNFWMQAKLALLKHTGEKTIYEWIPKPWPDVLHHERAEDFLSSLREEGYRAMLCVGDTSPLTTEIMRSWGNGVVTASNRKCPFANQPHTYFTVVGDFIFTVDVTPAHSAALSKLFTSADTRRHLDSRQTSEIFRKKSKFLLKLEEDGKRSAIIKRKFTDFFGPSKGAP